MKKKKKKQNSTADELKNIYIYWKTYQENQWWNKSWQHSNNIAHSLRASGLKMEEKEKRPLLIIAMVINGGLKSTNKQQQKPKLRRFHTWHQHSAEQCLSHFVESWTLAELQVNKV